MALDTQQFRAEARFQRVSPQKARLVLDLIKGRRVEEALQTVAFTKKAVAPLVEKVLRSAIENARYVSDEKGLDVDVDNLYVAHAVANDGPRMKRIRPAPMGRAYRYQRRLAHIVVAVAERRPGGSIAQTVDAETPAPAAARKRPAKKAAAKKAAPKKTAAKRTGSKKQTAKAAR
jgi:large subunit ribosomal protein L22